MNERKPKTELLIGLFLLGCVLFNYPILTLFNQRVTVFGIPLLYLYLFSVWSILIIATMLITKIRASAARPHAPGSRDAPDPVDRSPLC